MNWFKLVVEKVGASHEYMELGLSVGRSVERPVPHHFILTYLYFIFTLSLFGRNTGLEFKDGSGDLTVRQNVLACGWL